MSFDAIEQNRRIAFARGQITEIIGNIMQAFGDLSMIQNLPEVDRAWSRLSNAQRAARIAIAELDGTARACEPGKEHFA